MKKTRKEGWEKERLTTQGLRGFYCFHLLRGSGRGRGSAGRRYHIHPQPMTWVRRDPRRQTHVVGLSHSGSPRHARDVGRWMLSGAGDWVLGLLEWDRWFGFRCLFWSFSCRGSRLTLVVGLSRPVDALRRWWLGLGFAGAGPVV
jgi:hypothetical protein